jgi:hypothetical protein
MAHIKVRKRGERRFNFLTSKGGINHLRIHAAIFDDQKAVQFVEANAPDNPDFEWRIVR